MRSLQAEGGPYHHYRRSACWNARLQKCSACRNAQLAGTQHRLAPAQEDHPWSVPGKQLVQYYEVNDRVLGLPFLGRERCRYLDKKMRFGSIQRYWFLHLYYSQETLARRQPPKVTMKMPTTTWNQEKTRKEQFQTTRWERLCTCKDSDQWIGACAE